MTTELIGIIATGITLAGLLIGLFGWLRSDILELGARLDKRSDDQGKQLDTRFDKLNEKIGGLATELAALKATVETFFRVRIDPPPPNPEHHGQAA